MPAVDADILVVFWACRGVSADRLLLASDRL